MTVGALALAVGVSGEAEASLVTFQSFNGKVGLSTDGWGGLDGSGVVTANAPSGSKVVAAYLYTATRNSSTTPSVVKFGGNTLSYVNSGILPAPACCDLRSYRADVTSIVKSVIDSGSGGAYDFAIAENGNNSIIDGHALVVVYENAALPEASIGILDGYANVAGDTTSINFSDPLDPTAPGFFAEMRLGINFSCCNQKSTVRVNDQLLTVNAGNSDDGENPRSNGSLITMGGDDDPLSSGGASYEADRERYNLASFIGVGDTSIKVDTINASRDDNIFLATFFVRGRAGFNEPPPPVDPVDPDPNVIPLPAGAWLMLTGLAALGVARRRRRA